LNSRTDARPVQDENFVTFGEAFRKELRPLFDPPPVHMDHV
jgi:hypothetical protein